jgi:cell division protein FtsB
MSAKQSILLSIAIVGLVSLLLIIIFGDQGLADLQLMKKRRDHLSKTNQGMAQKNLSLHKEIHRLKHDPKFIENIARQELGMIGKDEIIFKLRNFEGKR